MTRISKNRAVGSVLPLLATIGWFLFFSPYAEGQCQDATATRPILFVPGILENSTAWGTTITGIRGNVIATMSGTPGYSNFTPYDLYFDGSHVRLAQVSPGNPLTDPIASNLNVPCDARNFAISFYSWGPNAVAFDPLAVGQVSIITKAYELSEVLKAIAGLTYVQDAIVIAHSMGALDARAYIERLGSTFAPCGTASQPCYLPGSLPYAGEVGHLITVDGTNGGANLANRFNGLLQIFGLGLVNVTELDPSGMVVQTLNYHRSYLGQGGTATAQPLPPNLTIDAIISYYAGVEAVPCALDSSLSCTWDLVVPNDSQSIVEPLLGKGFAGLNDTSLYFSLSDPSIIANPDCTFSILNFLPVPDVLHLLPCLGDWHYSPTEQVWRVIYEQAFRQTVGQLTTVNIQTTYNGQRYTGSMSLALQTPDSSISITNPQWTLQGPSVPSSPQVPQVPPLSPVPYTLTYISGGPPGAAAPSIQGHNADGSLCSPCYLKPGNWALTFSVAFTSGTTPVPTVTTQQASAVSGDGATLVGTANPNGANATAWFEWGPTSGLGQSTPVQSLGSGLTTVNVSSALTGLASSTPYYYRLDASNGGTTVYGNVWQFTTMGTLPNPTLLTPGNSSTGVPTSPTFTWSTVAGASSYRLLVATNSAALPTDPTSPSCGAGCVLDVTPTGTSYTVPTGILQGGTTYYWEVHARSALQFGIWSSPFFSFSTAASSLASVTINPTTINSGSPANVSVSLSGPAPAGGVLVGLASSNNSAFPAPTNITIPAGNITANVTVTSGSVSASTAVTVTAIFAGSTASGVLNIAPSGGSVFLDSLTITPSTIVGGYQTQGNVFLTAPAPAGGAVISISSNSTHFVQVPPSNTVTVQPGYTSGTFPITTSFTSGAAGATINATYNGTSYGAAVTVLPVVAAGVTFYPSTVDAGSPVQATVYLNGPAPTGTSISLMSSNPSVLTLPGTVPVPAGATSISVVATTLGITTQSAVTVTATYNGGSAQGTVTVVPLSLISFSLSLTEITGGSNVTGTVWLSDIAPSGGVNVTLSSPSNLVQFPATVNIPQGSSSANFTIMTPGVSSVSNVTIMASYNSVSFSLTLTLVPPLPYLASLSFSPSTVNSGSTATGTVTLTAPALPGGASISLVGSFWGVANVPSGVTVQSGATTASFAVPTSAIAFIAPVTVTATYSGFTQSAILTVVPPGTPFAPSSLTLSPFTVAGGSSSTVTVLLTEPAPQGGATLSLSSDNPLVQVTPLLQVAAGLNTATFQVTTSLVTVSSTATIKASYNGISQSSLLTVEPSGGEPNGNPVPLLVAPLMPVSHAPNGTDLSLTVNGSGFVSGAQAFWNGTAIPTTYVDSSQLQASVPAGSVQTNGSAVVTVKNPGPLSAASNGLGEYSTFSTSAPSFSTAGLTCTGRPGNVVVADLNGDGKLDLVVSNFASGLSVFLGNGDGTFGPELLLQAGYSAAAVVADFNGDGKPDIATAVGGAVRLFLGDGDGSFTAAADTSFFSGYISNLSLAAGDLNGDGKLDIVVTGAENNLSQAYVLLGNGDGTFGAAASFGLVNQPFGVAVGDFNGDGDLDLALTDAADSAVAVLLGNGDGTFQRQIEYPANGYPYALVVADFNGDGHSDIAVANFGPVSGNGGGVAVLMNNGDGTFAVPVNYGAGDEVYFLSTEDINGDGNLDLVAASTYPTSQTLIYFGKGNGTFNTTPLALSTGSGADFNAVADLNGDGAPDLVATGVSGGITGNMSILLQTIPPVLQASPAMLSYSAALGSGSPASSSFTVSNRGTGAVSWTATASQPWVSLPQTSGTAPSTLAVSVNPSGLVPGSYNATITVTAPGASNSPQNVAVALTVNPAPVVVSSLAFNPATLAGPGTTTGTVTLSGPAPTGGATITLSSSNAAVQAPAAVAVASGLMSASFTATASAVTSQTVVTITAAYNGGDTTASLTVQPGVPAVTLSPVTLSFGSVVLGSTSAKKTVKLTNSGTAALFVGAFAASGDYAQVNKCPTSLAPGATCAITVTFSPSVAGTVPGALTIMDSAGNSPQVVSLKGVGVSVLSVAPSSISFGTSTVGVTSPPSIVTLTNNSASSQSFNFVASADFAASPSGSQACGSNLAAGASCTIAVTFTPSQNGSLGGTLAISAGSFQTQLVMLSGSGTGGAISPLSFSPTTITFASQPISTTSPVRTLTATNTSSSSVNIISYKASGDFAAMGSGAKPCRGKLAVNAKCTLSVTFTPSVIGQIEGSVALVTNSSVNPLIYDLAGTGVEPVTLNPTDLTFGPQSIGTTSAPQTVTLSNHQAITLSVFSLVGSGNYSVFPGGNAPCGQSIGAHSTCTFQVTFAPTNTGAIQGAASIVHNASGSPQVVKLTGTGQ